MLNSRQLRCRIGRDDPDNFLVDPQPKSNDTVVDGKRRRSLTQRPSAGRGFRCLNRESEES